MSKQHIMLDLETMGTGPTAAITAIGAVAFSVEAGITDTFYKKVDLESAVRNGGTMDPDTVIWWLGQSDAARKEMQAKGDLLTLAQIAFDRWVADNCVRATGFAQPILWGNGAAFDNVILASAYQNAQMTPPWKFWNDRCYRTMKNTYPDVEYVKPLIAHHALHDAQAQAEHLIAIAKAYDLELQ